jgi:hypothetical protein
MCSIERFICEGTNLRPAEVIRSYVEFANHQWSSQKQMNNSSATGSIAGCAIQPAYLNQTQLSKPITM